MFCQHAPYNLYILTPYPRGSTPTALRCLRNTMQRNKLAPPPPSGVGLFELIESKAAEGVPVIQRAAEYILQVRPARQPLISSAHLPVANGIYIPLSMLWDT